MIQNNSVRATIPPFYAPISVLGDLTGGNGINYLKELIREKYPTLADLLIDLAYCESNFNQIAKGDNGTSFSLFQFKQTTWQENCEGDIWDAEKQIDCAVKLIQKGEGKKRWKNCWQKMNLDKYF